LPLSCSHYALRCKHRLTKQRWSAIHERHIWAKDFFFYMFYRRQVWTICSICNDSNFHLIKEYYWYTLIYIIVFSLHYLQQRPLNRIIYISSSIFCNHIIKIHFHCFFLYRIKLKKEVHQTSHAFVEQFLFEKKNLSPRILNVDGSSTDNNLQSS
jgi:hypothetical protein